MRCEKKAQSQSAAATDSKPYGTMIQSLMALKAHKEINMLSAIKSANLTDIGVGTASGTGFELSWRFGRVFGAFRGSGLRVRIPNKRAWRTGRHL